MTPTIDTTNILVDAGTTNTVSKYMSKTSDSSGFSNVFDKVNKNYSDNTFVKDTQYKVNNKQNSSAVNSESQPKVEKNEQIKNEEVKSKDNQVKQNSETEAGKTAEIAKQEQKIQDNKKMQEDELQEDIAQNAEESIKAALKTSLLAEDLQMKELTLEPEKLVQKIEVTKSENVKTIISDDVQQNAVEQLSTNKDLLSAIKSTNAEETSNNIQTSVKSNVLENIAEKLSKQDISLTDKNVQLKNTLTNTVTELSDDKTVALNTDKNANIIKTEDAVETPHVKVQNDNSLLQNVKTLNDEDKLNAKTILDNKNLNQQKLDDLDVKIKSVVNLSENNKNADSQNSQNNSENQNFLMHQNVQEQSIRFELQANSIAPVEQEVIQQTTSENIPTVNSIDALENLNSMQNLNIAAKNIDAPNVQMTTQNAQMPKELNSTDILSQIDKQLEAKSLQDSGTTKVSIVLKPENLGRLELELVSSKNGFEAKMIASSPQVKEILDKNIEALRESLGSQGVNVNNVSVKVAETQKSDTMFDFDQHQRNNQNAQKEQAQKSKGNNLSNQDFEQEIDFEQEVSQEILYTATEQTTTISGLNGRVAYKL